MKKPLRRQSFMLQMKREPVKNETFLNIQLKPVIKEKSTPQTAEQAESLLQKVKSSDSGAEMKRLFLCDFTALNSKKFNYDDILSESLSI